MKLLNIAFHILEVFAALAGTFFVLKNKDRVVKYFVYYLWLTVFVETVGTIPRIIRSTEYLNFLKGTIWMENDWLYNSYVIITFIIYAVFFRAYMKNEFFKKILKSLIVFFFLTSVLNLFFSDVFFNGLSSYSMIMGSILLLVSVMLYFYEVLQSESILSFHKSLPFYIAIGALVFYLSMTPLFIFNKYYSFRSNPEFVGIYRTIREIAIIFMYTCFTIGFLLCSKKNKSYS
ncbi:hypothetical protein SAMN04488508_105165 [Aquimarina spongiae]|uniref:Uncharacterized protein n=1 Tax=Aquimarina spongiae TaxID=570521 RepID=A0A1M6GAF9_9FLAO|nr:hypothetical protein SAMN04488508_105165 [Aquimarina spongiae]